MKKLIVFLALATVVFAGSVHAQITAQSRLPNQDNRFGYLVAKYDVGVDGGVGDIDVGPVLPENVVVVGGYIQVVTPVLPATATTNSITLETTADLLASGTSLATAGWVPLKPSGSATVLASATPSYDTFSVITGATLQVANVGTNGEDVVTNVVFSTASVNSFTNLATTTDSVLDGASLVVTGSTSRVTFNMGTTAATSGVVYVWLDLIQAQ